MNLKRRLLFGASLMCLGLPARAAPLAVKLYKNPNCACCDVYAEHLRSHGFHVQMISNTDMASVKRKLGVPDMLAGCHTAVLNDRIYEGLVPAKYIQQFIAEGNKSMGLSVPGMPVGAPGMPGRAKRPIHVYAFDRSTSRIYATF